LSDKAGYRPMLDDEIPSPRDLVRYAYRKLEAEREALFRIGVIPVFLQFMITVLFGPREHLDLAFVLALALNLIPTTLFDVAWLRRLLGADANDPLLPYRWTQRHTGFVGRLAILLGIVVGAFGAAVFVFAWLPDHLRTILLIVGSVSAFFVILRLSPFFVARAFDGHCDLAQAWAATRSGAGRFFWGAAFSFLPGFIVLGIVAGIAESTGIGSALPLVTSLLAVVISLIAHALLLAVIARVFEIRLMGFRKGEV
jgi:hypothetical protein